jgi:hypothetical protein
LWLNGNLDGLGDGVCQSSRIGHVISHGSDSMGARHA